MIKHHSNKEQTSVVMYLVVGIHISQEILVINVLTALKSSLEQRQKHVLQLLQLYGDQALVFEMWQYKEE